MGRIKSVEIKAEYHGLLGVTTTSEFIDVLKEDLTAEQFKHFNIKDTTQLSINIELSILVIYPHRPIYCGVNKEYEATKETVNINKKEWMQYKNGFC
jgi:hypothetical protein